MNAANRLDGRSEFIREGVARSPSQRVANKFAPTVRRLSEWPLVGTTVLALVTMTLTGCGNMKKQAYARPETANEHLARGTAAQLPPAHTVPHREHLPAAAFETGEKDGQLLTEIPIRVTPELLARGQDRFNIYCAVCHGPDGYGRGIVVQRGFPAPPSYHESRLLNAPVGHFFRVMTQGYGAMYPYADRLTPEDRWAVAAYIRALQLSQRATATDLTAVDREHLKHP
jgi:mono/diheme cytochrome c family protein